MNVFAKQPLIYFSEKLRQAGCMSSRGHQNLGHWPHVHILKPYGGPDPLERAPIPSGLSTLYAVLQVEGKEVLRGGWGSLPPSSFRSVLGVTWRWRESQHVKSCLRREPQGAQESNTGSSCWCTPCVNWEWLPPGGCLGFLHQHHGALAVGRVLGPLGRQPPLASCS